MRVGILGKGRLGRSMAQALRQRGCEVDLRGRGEVPTGDVVWLTVPDAAISSAAATIPPGPVLLHASGALRSDVLRPRHPVGSLHLLMTFPGPEVAMPDLRGVAAAVDGDPEAVEVGTALAELLGMRPFRVPGDRRLYHAAAVIAGNYATVLLAEASRVLAAAGVDPREAPALLAPLALQSIANARLDPARALTGPAARGDLETLAAHRAALEEAGLQDALALYDLLASRAADVARSRSNVDDPG